MSMLLFVALSLTVAPEVAPAPAADEVFLPAESTPSARELLPTDAATVPELLPRSPGPSGDELMPPRRTPRFEIAPMSEVGPEALMIDRRPPLRPRLRPTPVEFMAPRRTPVQLETPPVEPAGPEALLPAESPERGADALLSARTSSAGPEVLLRAAAPAAVEFLPVGN